jgi:hypothetical protein
VRSVLPTMDPELPGRWSERDAREPGLELLADPLDARFCMRLVWMLATSVGGGDGRDMRAAAAAAADSDCSFGLSCKGCDAVRGADVGAWGWLCCFGCRPSAPWTKAGVCAPCGSQTNGGGGYTLLWRCEATEGMLMACLAELHGAGVTATGEGRQG